MHIPIPIISTYVLWIIGGETPLTIVCGANVAAGQTVPVALVGATLPAGSKSKGQTEGVESSGMIAPDPNWGCLRACIPMWGGRDPGYCRECGPRQRCKEIFGLDNVAVDFEILANRPDCLSIWGLARESSAVLEEHCLMPEIVVEENGTGTFLDYAHVEVRDKSCAPLLRVIEGVKIGPSPKWMRAYLHAAGCAPSTTSLTLPITSCWRQAIHARLRPGQGAGSYHCGTPGRSKETLKTLDGKSISLPRICWSSQIQRVLPAWRVSGRRGIEILEDTRAVLFECAVFDRTNNRLTSGTGCPNEASGRFERGRLRGGYHGSTGTGLYAGKYAGMWKSCPAFSTRAPSPKKGNPFWAA